MKCVQGDRVASCIIGYYKGIPGTVEGRCQMQDLSRRGWDLDIVLDSGQTVRINEDDLEPVTPEIEEAYRKRVEETERVNRRARERNARLAEGRRRQAEEGKALRRQAEEEAARARQNEYEETQREIREEKGREYGLRSLRR